MRGAPHVGLSPTTRKMSSQNSLLTNVLPTRTLRREIQAQYSLKPSRCQRTTVSGWTRVNARFHPGHKLQPILPARYLEASCGQCHWNTLTGTPQLNLGRQLLARYGCASCHVLKTPEGRQLASTV